MNPTIDWHAFAPDIVLVATILVILVADLLLPNRSAWQTSRIAALGVLGALIPVLTLAVDGHNRSMFGGAYVVDNYALAFKGFFLVVTYIAILLSVDYISEGDYYQGEFYFLLLTSVLGMSVMASGRDLITLFVALETISIPTYVLAGYRKHDRRSNEAGIKYYLIGVLSSAVMLYGMSLIFGLTGTTTLSGISAWIGSHADTPALLTVAIFLSLVGFAFKVSAVPFHFWAPDTYEGAPTPVTAFLSGRVEGRRLRRDAQHRLLRVRQRRQGLVVGRRVARRVLDDAGQPRRAAPDEPRAHAGLLVDRAGRIPARSVRGLRHRAGRVGAHVGISGDDRLPAHLRRHEPRRVRGAHRSRAPHPLGRDLVVRGAVLDVARVLR